MFTLTQAVKRHAIANYNTDGWDIVVECYSDDELATLIGDAQTIADAIARVFADVAPHASMRDEIRAENY
jgi:hypothetical protein